MRKYVGAQTKLRHAGRKPSIDKTIDRGIGIRSCLTILCLSAPPCGKKAERRCDYGDRKVGTVMVAVVEMLEVVEEHVVNKD